MPCPQYLDIGEWSVQPAPEHAAAHGRYIAVQHRQQCVAATAAHIDVDFQIAPGCRVQDDTVCPVFLLQRANMRQIAALRILHVLQQAAGGADGKFETVATEALQIVGLELGIQGTTGALCVKLPAGLAARTPARGDNRVIDGFVVQSLRRIQALQFTGQGFLAGDFQHSKASRAQVQVGDAVMLLLLAHGQQQIVHFVVQQGFIGQGARRHNPHHLAIHGPLAGGRIADLLGDGHRDPGLHQSRQIILCSVVGHAAHGNGFPGGFSARGERNIQQFGRALGILIKQLVKITHTVEHQVLRVICLDAQELLHHWGMGVESDSI